MRYLNIGLALIFFGFAALQINDPDPLYWISVYAATGLVALGRNFSVPERFWTAVVLGAVIAGMLIALPGIFDYLRSGNYASITAEMRTASYVEPAREFLGLFMAMLCLLYCLRR